MNQHKIFSHDLIPIFFMGCFFVIINFLAIALIWPFETAGMQAFEETNNFNTNNYDDNYLINC